MRDLLMQFLGREISRREFGQGLAALGLSAPAVNALLGNAASAQLPPPAEGVAFTGTGAEVLVETLRAAGVRYIFGTTATGMSAFFDALTLRPDPQMILSLAESQATSMAHGYELATNQALRAHRARRRRPQHDEQPLQRLEGPLVDPGAGGFAPARTSRAATASSRWTTGWSPWWPSPSGAGSCATSGRSRR